MANDVLITVRSKDQTAAGMNSAEKRAGGLGRVLGRVGETAAGFLAANVVRAGFDAFKGYVSDSIEESSRLNESLNAVDKIFGSSAPTILKWGKNNATSFGLSQQAFNELATPLGAGLKNAGLSLQDTSKWTIDLTKRAADMASVFNTDVDTALGAIQAGLRGESDPLEQFGVGLSAAKVEARALADTGKKNADALTSQELATARLNLIMAQTKATAGDFRSTSDQLANSTRIQQARSEELQAEIGTRLTPVMLKLNEAKLALVEIISTKVLPAVDRFTTWASENQGVVKVLAGVIGGILVVALAAYTVAAASAAVATIAATWPILLIIAAVAALAVGIFYLVKHWDKVWGKVREIASSAGRRITGVLRRAWGAIVSDVQSVGRRVSGAFRAYIAMWVGRFRSFVGAAKAVWHGLSSLVSTIRGIFGRVLAAVRSRLSAVVSLVRGLPGRIKRGLGNLGRLLYGAGKALIQGLINGIKNMAGSAVRAARGVASSAVQGAKRLLHINSPSKVAEKEIGEPIGQGVVVGLNRARGMVAAAGASMAGSAIPGTTTGGRAARQTGPVVIEVRSGGSRLDDLLVEVLRHAIRARGGNVQTALGKA